jgi:anti-sigma regulatory factor (Ser/Thr protein kinase)
LDSKQLIDMGAHVVRFYERDGELADAVSGYLGGALANDEAAIAVATPEHMARFEEEMTSAGVDVQAALEDNRLVVLDASETLDRFMRDGWPEEAAFDDVIGGVLRSANAAGRPVRAYGEMVAVLWDSGLISAAVRLEELWNGLAERTPFSLFCAYPAEIVGGAHDVESLVNVCHLHSAVVGAPPDLDEASEVFANVSMSPRAARRFVTRTLRDWGHPELVDAGAAVVTELATNALLHARSGFEVRLLRSRDLVRLAVSDSGHGVPALRDPGGRALSGRGLVMVDALTTRWGHWPRQGGKLVWADLGA